MDLDKVGKFMAENRKKQNLTQKDLGELLGINPKTVSKWERGVNAPDIALLTDIAKYLNITVEELLAGEKIKRNKFSIKKFIYNNINKSNKTSRIVTVTFIIFALFSIISFAVYKYSSNKDESEIYKISTSNEDYLVSGYLFLNDNEYAIDITEIRSKELDIERSVDIKFNILNINFVSNENILYNYSMKEEGDFYLYEELKKHEIKFNRKEENAKYILNSSNEIGIKYCITDDECSSINLNLTIEKVE